MRSVVFRTPGKLDLRSITVFGLNAKPQSNNPIGFFGTGLKYGVAVLMRTGHKITIWVGSQKWTIEPKDTTFRNKTFQSIVLLRHRNLLPPKEIVLPFTTELGKTWELWQAFRELYANTLDENGETYVMDEGFDPNGKLNPRRNHTYIIVEGEAFVQEYLEREKTFLPDALRQQTEEPVQRFDRPNKFVYWRGMRIYDLREPSIYTYNILSPIELTEDRTAKFPYQIHKAIEEYIRNHATKDVVRQVVTAPQGKFEHKLDYDYHWTAPSTTFIEVVKEAPQDLLSQGAKKHAAAYIPVEPKKPLTKDELFNKAHDSIERGDDTSLIEALNEDRAWFLELLQAGKDQWDAAQSYVPEREDPHADERCVDCGNTGECAPGCPQRIPDPMPTHLEDEIPF